MIPGLDDLCYQKLSFRIYAFSVKIHGRGYPGEAGHFTSNIISGLGQKSLCPMDAQTAGPIVPKFGMGIQEHLEIKIVYVLLFIYD